MSLPDQVPTYQVEVSGPDPSPSRASEINHLPARDGETLLRALQWADAPILSVCGGQASCGACRIQIQADWFARLTAPGKVEAMLLDCLDAPLPHHRLSCQIVVTPALGGLRFTIAP